MDDIAGLKWTSTPANGQKPTNASANYSAFSTLRPTPPASGRASPLDASSSQPQSKSTTPANDSFANLVPFAPSSNKNVSLLEQQKRLAETKLRQQQTQTQVVKDQYSGGDEQFWKNLGSGRGTPVVDNTKSVTTRSGISAISEGGDDDLFAAFNKPATAANDSVAPPVQKRPTIDEDDDPFGLSEFGQRRTETAATTSTMNDDDDDVLGLLGRPVSTRPAVETPPPQIQKDTTEIHPQDKAIAELVDMGFPADKARLALESTETGMDVQAAVGLLLNQAHAEARQKAQPRDSSRHDVDVDGIRRNGRAESEATATRMHWDEGQRSRNRSQGQGPGGEKDFEQMAADFGSNFLKTAGSLWKQGTKRVQQAVQELNADGDPATQPRWMREGEKSHKSNRGAAGDDEEAGIGRSRRRSPEAPKTMSATDEALMLESSRPTPPTRPSASSRSDRPERRFDSSAETSRDHSPALPSRLRETLPQQQPAFMRQQNQSPAATSRSKLNKAAADEQAAQAYVSSARRRKPQGTTPPVAASEPDLLDGSFKGAVPSQASAVSRPRPAVPSQSLPPSRTETPVRPPAPKRSIPAVSAISLQTCSTHREKGNEHFKRGDYSSAHASYATSLSHLPATHPLVIVLLTNRALTALKIGEPKSAISDADKALSVIGSSKGESETIDFGNGDTPKPMREYYGKALMRKAEALEQMEKWADAAAVWREAVEGGHGGATSIQGRLRAEKAAQPQSETSRPKPAAATAVKRPTPTPRRPVTTAPATHAAAVSRLRAANAAAEKADDEKFRLGDAVDARIQAWKGGKADNLRALLGSLENVLWEGSGWKKISMADLVLPGKVKVQYMKGIAKVHPDKVRSIRHAPFFLGRSWARSLGLATLLLTASHSDPDRRDDRAAHDRWCGF